MRVLVVEDDRKTAEFVAKALKEEGFEVDVVHDGNDAVAALAAGSFEAIVLDVMIPGRDGLAVVRHARELGNKTPVLLLSARGSVEERV